MSSWVGGVAGAGGVLEPTPGLSSPAASSFLNAWCSGDNWDPKNAGLSGGGGSPTGWVGPSWFLFPTLRHTSLRSLWRVYQHCPGRRRPKLAPPESPAPQPRDLGVL